MIKAYRTNYKSLLKLTNVLDLNRYDAFITFLNVSITKKISPIIGHFNV